ncbi:MAG: ATP/GTP-binding protein, partial [Clostridia bacterium]|nr:ATP/GTP-binding protein [Clostridia bacterium]
MERLTIVTGHYGSGKTTFALNYACDLAAAGKTVTVVDLDIVNPYFRTADHRAMLEARGVTVVSPPYANTNLDLPGLSAQIYGAFEKQ